MLCECDKEGASGAQTHSAVVDDEDVAHARKSIRSGVGVAIDVARQVRYGPADFRYGLLLTIQELTDDFLKLLVENGTGFLMGLRSSLSTISDLAGKGVGRGLQDSMPQRLRILLMYVSCDAETAPEASRVYFTDRYQ